MSRLTEVEAQIAALTAERDLLRARQPKPHTKMCPLCHGFGHGSRCREDPCEKCRGTGRVVDGP